MTVHYRKCVDSISMEDPTQQGEPVPHTLRILESLEQALRELGLEATSELIAKLRAAPGEEIGFINEGEEVTLFGGRADGSADDVERDS